MKKVIASIVLALVFMGFIGCSGCGTFGTRTYQATATSAVTVDAAMSAWGRYVAAHHPGPDSEQKVKSAYETYQKSISLVADAGSAYLKAKQANAPNLPQAQIEFNAAVAGASAALSDLVTLLVGLGVKI